MSTLITALRGFKLRPDTLDYYLAMNRNYNNSTDGGRVPPQYQYDDRGAASDPASEILRARAAVLGGGSDSGNILVVLPLVEPHEQSPWVYVAYSYAFIYSQLLITTGSLPDRVPRGFEELRQEILERCPLAPDAGEQGTMGFYIVATDNCPRPLPLELKDKYRVCLVCF